MNFAYEFSGGFHKTLEQRVLDRVIDASTELDRTAAPLLLPKILELEKRLRTLCPSGLTPRTKVHFLQMECLLRSIIS